MDELRKLDLSKSVEHLSWLYDRYAEYDVCKCGSFSQHYWPVRVCPHCGSDDFHRVVAKIVPGPWFWSKKAGATVVYKDDADG